jgi:hypothetical protein
MRRTWPAVAALLALSSCTSLASVPDAGPSAPKSDAAEDAARDEAGNGGTDAGADADAGENADAPASTEAAVDAREEAATDAGTDRDATADATLDAAPDVDATSPDASVEDASLADAPAAEASVPDAPAGDASTGDDADAGGPCTLVSPQTGCTAGEACVIEGFVTETYNADAQGTIACVPAGTLVQAQACTSLSDCAPGYECYRGACEKFCASDGDCADGACAPTGFPAVGVSTSLGLGICSDACDLIAQTGCNPSEQCYLDFTIPGDPHAFCRTSGKAGCPLGPCCSLTTGAGCVPVGGWACMGPPVVALGSGTYGSCQFLNN